MPFPPPRNHVIDYAAASALTAEYRKRNPGAIKAGLFPVDVFKRLLGQTGIHGIRIYYGQDPDGAMTTVLAGVDREGADMLPGGARGEGDEDPNLYEFSFPCPIYCGPGNGLNGGG